MVYCVLVGFVECFFLYCRVVFRCYLFKWICLLMVGFLVDYCFKCFVFYFFFRCCCFSYLCWNNVKICDCDSGLCCVIYLNNNEFVLSNIVFLFVYVDVVFFYVNVVLLKVFVVVEFILVWCI